jgi:hypothetical protein
MYTDTATLYDDIPSDDDLTPGLEDMTEVIRTTSDRLALPALAELLEHPPPAVRAAAVEALGTLRPSPLELRRQLSPRALARVRNALGEQRTRVTRKARRVRQPPRRRGAGSASTRISRPLRPDVRSYSLLYGPVEAAWCAASFEVTSDAAGSLVTSHPPPRAWTS